MEVKRIDTSARYSEAVIHNNTVYLAGTYMNDIVHAITNFFPYPILSYGQDSISKYSFRNVYRILLSL